MNKLKKFIVILSIIFIISLLSCCKDDVDNTNTFKDENKTVLYIEVSGYEEESIYQNEKYSHSDNVIITAYYSDDSSLDVTEYCFFYNISTYYVGTVEQRVQYVYNDDIVYCTYDVTVLEYTSSHLELDYSNCKLIYKKREVLDYSNLVVTAVYPNGVREQTKTYDVEIYNEEGVLFKKDSQLVSTGRHTVTIKFQDIEKSYSIMVYDDKLPSYDIIIDDFSSDEFPTNNLTSNSLIFTTPYIALHANGVNTKFTYNNISYGDNSYNKALNISCDDEAEDFDGITFSVRKQTTVLMLISCDNNCLNFYNESSEGSDTSLEIQNIEIFGLSQGIGIVMFNLDIGNYNLASFGEETEIYSMTFIFEDSTEIETLDSIKLNQDTIKDSYDFFESISNIDVEVYGVSNEEEQLLDISEYSISLYYDGKIVSSFEKEGNYEVIIRYVGQKLCLNRTVKKTVTCVDTKNYSMYIKEFTINGNSLNTNINQLVYYYNIDSNVDNVNIKFDLYNNKDYTILVNNKEYQTNSDFEIELSSDQTQIDIFISNEVFTLGYSITIIKNN